MTLITCAVKTNAFADYHAPEIPNRSPYSAIRELIKRITDGSLQKGAISAEKYADDVVSKVEKGAVGTVWVGTDALMARLVLGVLPQWIIVSFEMRGMLWVRANCNPRIWWFKVLFLSRRRWPKLGKRRTEIADCTSVNQVGYLAIKICHMNSFVLGKGHARTKLL